MTTLAMDHRFYNILPLLSLVCVFLSVADCADDVCNVATTTRLKKDLLCYYDKSQQPVRLASKKTLVNVTMWLRHFTFRGDEAVMELHSWLGWSWKDPLLSWDPEKYSGLTEVYMDANDIWLPETYHHTSHYTSAMKSNMVSPSDSCLLTSDGVVLSLPAETFYAMCNQDLTRWPFDSQICSVKIGTWWFSGDMIDMEPVFGGISLTEYERNRDWELGAVNLSKQTFEFKEGTYPLLEFTFQLKRHSGGHSATVFIPALVLTVLTLVSFWLEPLGPNRFTVCCMNVLVHCLYLQYLGVKLPSNGDSCPLIVLFYRDSLLLAAISLMVAVLVRGMTVRSSVVPVWISSLLGWILRSIPGRMLLLRELNSAPKDETTKTDVGAEGKPESVTSAQIKPIFQWQLFALLMDRLFFLVFLPTYSILLSSFIP